MPEGVANGERVFVDGESGSPMGPGGMKKKKIFEALAKELKTNGRWCGVELCWVWCGGSNFVLVVLCCLGLICVVFLLFSR